MRCHAAVLNWDQLEVIMDTWPHSSTQPAFDAVLVSDVVYGDEYGRLVDCLLYFAQEGVTVIFGFEDRTHKRPELASPNFVKDLNKAFRKILISLDTLKGKDVKVLNGKRDWSNVEIYHLIPH